MAWAILKYPCSNCRYTHRGRYPPNTTVASIPRTDVSVYEEANNRPVNASPCLSATCASPGYTGVEENIIIANVDLYSSSSSGSALNLTQKPERAIASQPASVYVGGKREREGDKGRKGEKEEANRIRSCLLAWGNETREGCPLTACHTGLRSRKHSTTSCPPVRTSPSPVLLQPPDL